MGSHLNPAGFWEPTSSTAVNEQRHLHKNKYAKGTNKKHSLPYVEIIIVSIILVVLGTMAALALVSSKTRVDNYDTISGVLKAKYGATDVVYPGTDDSGSALKLNSSLANVTLVSFERTQTCTVLVGDTYSDVTATCVPATLKLNK